MCEMCELTRRMTGKSVQEWLAEPVAAPPQPSEFVGPQKPKELPKTAWEREATHMMVARARLVNSAFSDHRGAWASMMIKQQRHVAKTFDVPEGRVNMLAVSWIEAFGY